MFYQLLRPFHYLTINHPAKKAVDWYFPAVLALATLLLLFWGRNAINVWGSSGLVELLQGLVQGLPGFYIAALAAVATFGKQTALDSLIPEPTPTIETLFGSQRVEIELTRRRFLCLLFAHLTALSICLSVFSALGRAFAVPILKVLSPTLAEMAFYGATALYVFFLFQMFIVTLWGLYYLSDKMHQPDPNPIEEVGAGNEGSNE